ncbi:hypothetical protein EC957_007568 [Mortierella hygrophila]|uniref:HCP-like protein n=1 Tax=Mortierella hygrophila TaxID=979708 RepID=A0A9P6EYA4_9FUNG|nr:hypothetical protein EC957_007568 [Mortierella hygrophila]
MLQGDSPQDQIQALRSVNRGIPPNSIPPASPDDIYYIDTLLDPDTQKEFIFWDDIVQAFDHAVQVRHKARVVTFLRGKDHAILEPRRIAAIPGIVLDVVVDAPVTDNAEVTSPQIRQVEFQPLPPQDGSAKKMETISQNATPASSAMSRSSVESNTTFSSSTPSTATCTVRRNPVYGLVEEALENYTHIDRPLAFPSARGPHEVLDDQPPTIKEPVIPPHSVNTSDSQLQGPQSVITNVPMEKDVVQMSISASHGDKDAQVALGDMYKDGKGIAQDYQAAMDWYLKAAQQGHATAQSNIGILYSNGRGVPQDYVQAMEWYLKAAQQGHAPAQFNIGILYDNGRGVPQDYAQAMEWYLKAAQQGHATAQSNIGILYSNGRGVPQDYVQAMEWYLKAAQQEDASAQSNIGNNYYSGRGVPQDYAQAMGWYLKAAQQGGASAQFNIGVLYNNGRGVPQDYAQAIEWYLKAAQQGHEGAKRELEALKSKDVALS